MNTLSTLPSDIALEIFKWLPCPASLRYARVSKRYGATSRERASSLTGDSSQMAHPALHAVEAPHR